MRATVRTMLREWYIVGIALCLIAAGFFLASRQTASLMPSATALDSQSPGATPQPAPVTALAAAPAATEPPHSHNTAAAPSDVRQPTATPSPPPPHDIAAAQTSATTSTSSSSRPSGDGDAAAGRLVFRKCQACHSMEPGKAILGPSLAGIIGRKAASEASYNYSPAMKQANFVWDAKTLDAYLSDPQKVVPGNKMPFPGLKTDHDRADVIAFFAAANAGAQPAAAAPGNPTPAEKAPAAANHAPSAAPPADASYMSSDAKYTLRSGIAEGRMVYIGVGGAIDGKVNPLLTAAEGQVVELTLINGEGAEHDIVFPDQNAKSPRVTGKGSSTTIAFRAAKAGDFIYFCGVPGHQLAGMQGQFIITTRPAPPALVEADISREPTDLPPPIAKREPQTVRIDLLSVEVEGRLAEGTTFGY